MTEAEASCRSVALREDRDSCAKPGGLKSLSLDDEAPPDGCPLVFASNFPSS
jgi:hypothetical protein